MVVFALVVIIPLSFYKYVKSAKKYYIIEPDSINMKHAKFGEENLKDTVKENYFDNPQNETHEIKTNIAFESDEKKAVSVDSASFIHYDDGSISFLQNGALLDLDE